jgi:hypothetical protein
MGKDSCETCASTGILSAKLVRNEETGEKKIVVKPCTQHFSSNLLDKNVAAMVRTGLTVAVIEAKSES